MLFEILAIILAIYAVLSPLWVIKAVQFGMKVNEKPKEAAEKPFFSVPKKKKEEETPKELQKFIDINANIDAFDGFGENQKEIKDV